MAQTRAPDPVTPQPDELDDMNLLVEALQPAQGKAKKRYFISDTDGERRIELPRSALEVLLLAALELSKGRSITILHQEEEITTQEAANLLNVSRPFLIKLLEQGAMPFSLVGSHRRIRIGDLIAYKEKRDQHRKERLAEIRRVSESMGLYEEE